MSAGKKKFFADTKEILEPVINEAESNPKDLITRKQTPPSNKRNWATSSNSSSEGFSPPSEKTSLALIHERNQFLGWALVRRIQERGHQGNLHLPPHVAVCVAPVLLDVPREVARCFLA
jgi:hypothetical protein